MATHLRALSALALVGVIAVGGCSRGTDTAASGAGSKAGQRTDDSGAPAAPRSTTEDLAVTAKVKAALLASDAFKGTDIGVDTMQGTVIITGKVADPSQIERATAIARTVEGVRSVDNRLLVSNS